MRAGRWRRSIAVLLWAVLIAAGVALVGLEAWFLFRAYLGGL